MHVIVTFASLTCASPGYLTRFLCSSSSDHLREIDAHFYFSRATFLT